MAEINTILVTGYGANLKYLIDINNYPEGLIMLTQLLLQYSDYFEQISSAARYLHCEELDILEAIDNPGKVIETTTIIKTIGGI